jgi:hypothetical protein
MALRPLLDSALPQKTPPLFSNPNWSCPTSYYEDSLIRVVRSSCICKSLLRHLRRFFRHKFFFLRGEFVGLYPKAQHGGEGYPFSSESAPLTSPAWETLPVASLPLSKEFLRYLHYVKVGIPSGDQGKVTCLIWRLNFSALIFQPMHDFRCKEIKF